MTQHDLYDRIYISLSLIPGGRYRVRMRTGDHAPIKWVIEIETRKGNWKFPDILLNDITFMEGLHNTIKDALSEFATDTRVELENLQQEINFEVHNSMEIFTKFIRKV